ncbi:hypothetical protein Cni_G05864 [Canna indica]|uniref:Uncharacterized protein n=1 Tax=Canna indica TaxID=4628 RepID=A0AAQ3JVY9_9LILI|nr:hypothetical protein Cni_G05864 [Canna indica]
MENPRVKMKQVDLIIEQGKISSLVSLHPRVDSSVEGGLVPSLVSSIPGFIRDLYSKEIIPAGPFVSSDDLNQVKGKPDLSGSLSSSVRVLSTDRVLDASLSTISLPDR